MSTLQERQAALVRALVTGGEAPAGMDPRRVRVAENALLRKRSGEIARHLPLVHAELGAPRFTELFLAWARGRERGGSSSDAVAFVAQLTDAGLWVPQHERRPTTLVVGRLRRLVRVRS